MPHVYYTLISSLPALPYFAEADYLPINSVRLRERLGMLHPEDADLVRRALDLVAWQLQPVDRSVAETVTIFHELENVPQLQEPVRFRSDMRTVVAALRRRRAGLPAPGRAQPWGIGRLVDHIERHWEASFFQLERRFPWVPGIASLLEKRDSLAVERRLFELRWQFLSRYSQGREFRFEDVLAYLFKWDILKRWLSYRQEDARTVFQNTIESFTASYEHHAEAL